MARFVNRKFDTLGSKGILRSAVEEFMQSALREPRGVPAAECSRARRREVLCGRQLLSLRDAVVAADASRTTTVAVSSNAARKNRADAESVYSFRPKGPDARCVSPREFRLHFKEMDVRRPSGEFCRAHSIWAQTGK